MMFPPKVTALMCPLRLFWDIQKLRGISGPAVLQGEAGDVDDESTKMLASATVAIAKPWFWAYSQMLLELGAALAHMEHFLLSCPCHGGDAAKEVRWGGLCQINCGLSPLLLSPN